MAEQLAIRRHQLEMAKIDIQLRQLNETQARAIGAGDLAPLVAAITRQGDQMASLIQLMAQKQATPPVDVAGIVQKVAEMMRPARSGLGGLEELQAVVNVVKGLMPAPATGGLGIDGIRDIIALGKELAGGGEETVAHVIKSGIETLGKPLADAYFADKQQPPALAAPSPAPNPQAPQPPPEAPMTEEAKMKMFVAMLLGAASRQEPPDLWVDQVLYHVPDEALDIVVNDPMTILARIDRRVTLHEPWFRELASQVKAARDEFNDDDTKGVDTSGP
ncbi:MAG: hypothetical protein ACYCVW_16470 [Rhodocyclaceae bacterium]